MSAGLFLRALAGYVDLWTRATGFPGREGETQGFAEGENFRLYAGRYSDSAGKFQEKAPAKRPGRRLQVATLLWVGYEPSSRRNVTAMFTL